MREQFNPINIEDSLILIADDNAVTLQLLATFMDKEGLNYITCNNGSAALTLAKEKLPDLILLDIMMPHIDGFETCRLLKENSNTKDIPIIFLTSRSENSDKIKGYNAGAVDYLTKPFEKVEVMIRIKTQLKLKKALEKLNVYNECLEKVQIVKTKKESNYNPHLHSN
jgi:DNA-binding response OmpR family regulator